MPIHLLFLALLVGSLCSVAADPFRTHTTSVKFHRSVAAGDEFDLNARYAVRTTDSLISFEEAWDIWEMKARRKILSVDPKGVPTQVEFTLQEFKHTRSFQLKRPVRRLAPAGAKLIVNRAADGVLTWAAQGWTLEAGLAECLTVMFGDTMRMDEIHANFAVEQPVHMGDLWPVKPEAVRKNWMDRVFATTPLPNLKILSSDAHFQRLEWANIRDDCAVIFVNCRAEIDEAPADGWEVTGNARMRLEYFLPIDESRPITILHKSGELNRQMKRDNKVASLRMEADLSVTEEKTDIPLNPKRGAHAVKLNAFYKVGEKRLMEYTFQPSDPNMKVVGNGKAPRANYNWIGELNPLEIAPDGTLKAFELYTGVLRNMGSDTPNQTLLPSRSVLKVSVVEGKIQFTPITEDATPTPEALALLEPLFMPEVFPFVDGDALLRADTSHAIGAEWKAADIKTVRALLSRGPIASYEGPVPRAACYLLAQGGGPDAYPKFSVDIIMEGQNTAKKSRDGKPLLAHRPRVDLRWAFKTGASRPHSFSMAFMDSATVPDGAAQKQLSMHALWMRNEVEKPRVSTPMITSQPKWNVVLKEIRNPENAGKVLAEIKQLGNSAEAAKALLDRALKKEVVVLKEGVYHDKSIGAKVDLTRLGCVVELK